MRVVKLAQCPPPSVSPEASVLDAVRIMEQANVGAAAVMQDGGLVGVISERDVMLRVVAARRNPESTRVRDVMTSGVKTVRPDCETDEALAVMVSNHIRHVLLVNDKGSVVGLASARNLFQAQVESLGDQVHTLEAYAGNDNLGG
jgi:CBS domain-containing protein